MKADDVEVLRKRITLTLKDWGIHIVSLDEPDPQHFGNWVLIGRDRGVVFRFVCDRGDLQLDLMPASLFKFPEGNSESDWYTWDVVASAANLPFSGQIPPLDWFLNYRDGIYRAFSPENWEHTRQRLVDVEGEKRRRFTQGRRVSAHA